ncbi:MAG: glycosyltransferase family 2 protein [Flavisolibacter sp.]
MSFLAIIFWISITAVFYNYAGYAIFVYLANKLRSKRVSTYSEQYYPSVSFIVAAYNEEDCIESKALNSLKQEYPADRIEFLFITDGSTDRTNELLAAYPNIRLLYESSRRGKTAALNRVVQEARHEILIFSDANTVLNPNATREIVKHYSSPRVGCVAGEKKVLDSGDGKNQVGAGEGLYWKYESFLKKLDSDFYSVVGAAGELFSLRKTLYEPIAEDVILDDFVISMKVALKGYRIVYEPGAYAMELPSFSMGDEQKRKVRIAAGGFQAMAMLKPLFYFWKTPKLSFLYISHRVLRWTLSPVCLILLLVTNIFLLREHWFYQLFFAAQAMFYLMALLYKLMPNRFSGIKFLKLPHYFVFMNVSVIQGFFRYLKKNQSAAWEKARRSTPQPLATPENH